MDHITLYATNAENDQIRKLAQSFGLDENKLRNMMTLPVSAKNLNEYGRFDDLLNSVNYDIARKSLEEIYGKTIEIWEAHVEVQKILRDFILQGGFDLKSLNNDR